MNVKLSEDKTTRERKYPYIGYVPDTGSVVIFTAENTGLALRHKQGGIHWDEGGWLENDFVVYEGTVILSNDMTRR